MSVVIDGTAGVTTPAVTASGTVEGATMTEGGVAMPRMVLSTAQNTTSGTSIDFTGIPSWVKKITVMLAGVSTNGASQVLVQLGTSGGIDATGYTGTTGYNSSYVNHSTGFNLDTASSPAASTVRTGSLVLTLVGSNQWVTHGVLGLESAGGSLYVGGRKTLSGTLDRLRLTTVNGTDTFDAGSVNLLLEG